MRKNMILQTIFCKHQCLRSHNINFNFYLQKTPKINNAQKTDTVRCTNSFMAKSWCTITLNVINMSFNIKDMLITFSIKIYMHITDFLLL